MLVFGASLASLVALVVRRDWLPPLWVDILAAVGVYAGLWWLHTTSARGGGVAPGALRADV